MTLSDFLKTLPQYLAPQHPLSKLMHFLTRARLRMWKEWQIRWFIRRYGVDMSIAAQPDLLAYENFNSFFTRALKEGVRPIAKGTDEIACPVDGAVSQVGPIEGGRIFQAKGHTFSLQDLLGGSATRAAPFHGGQFATLYLAPKDYHRIHMPLSGQLREMVYVPGRLFGVNTRTTAVVPDLFARNERVIAIFDTDAGPMALVLVGALFVASIETVWAGAVTPPFGKSIQQWDYTNQAIHLARGAEMGRFNMGSTVIVLFGAGNTAWSSELHSETVIKMGESLGRATT